MNFPSSFVHCADSVAFWIAATITAVSCSSGLILVHAFSARPFAAFRGYAFQNVMNEPFRPVRFARTRVCCLLSVSVSDTEFASNVLALGASNVLADSRKPQAINGLRLGFWFVYATRWMYSKPSSEQSIFPSFRDASNMQATASTLLASSKVTQSREESRLKWSLIQGGFRSR